MQKEFGLFAEMNLQSTAEIFGGKICASLDRQHPRDLFDIHYLLQNYDFHEEIKHGFIVGLLSHPKPIHEMLKPNLHDQRETFDNQFSGMTLRRFSYQDFEYTRLELLRIIGQIFNEKDKKFFLSFKSGIPKWELINIENLSNLPATMWKLLNVQKLAQQNPKKHTQQIQKLKEIFN